MIRSFLALVLGSLGTAVTSVISMIIMLFDRQGKSVQFIMSKWAWFLLKLAGVKIEVNGLENITQGESYIFISNHASLLDIPTVCLGLPFQLRFLAKKELFKIPLFGPALLSAGHIKIDRGNLESAVKSLKEAAIVLKKRGYSALVFAEGTRSLNGEVGRFKKGGVILALSMGIPIVPVSISGSASLAAKGVYLVKSGGIKMTIGKPISTEGKDISARHQLVSVVRDEVIKNLVEEDAV
ncbi:MAG: 1-acyl-sn-glycerol-3-phosphate acyltransferase [Candidatus Marinimicrobia bacterium]|nr:1-acyl-sn-glycerol-3-phosphate acyltransferase [Candidatus Neomarinimicrobiota bacterium]TFB10258.1 1-acyl-sn-glycerol-3-phosphate acyltransferase [Candidatus Marinimicrobia bacterium MT.SAG.2]